MATLEKEGLSPRFHQLDILDQSSIDRLKGYLVKEHGGLDVLVNNAGIAFKVGVLFQMKNILRYRIIPIKRPCPNKRSSPLHLQLGLFALVDLPIMPINH